MKKNHIVIIPIHDELIMVKEMLSAFLKNTNLNTCSVYVIDDGNDTATIDYLKTVVKKNNNVFLHQNQKNLGKPKSINKVIRDHKNADFFTIIDSDIKITTKNWNDLLLKAHTIFNNKSILGGATNQNGFEFKKSDMVFGDMFPFWTLVGNFFSVPKFVFNKLGYFYDKIRRHEDADYCRRAATQNIRWYYTPNIKTKELKHLSYSNKKEYQNLKTKEENIYKKRAEHIMKTHNIYYNPFKN